MRIAALLLAAGLILAPAMAAEEKPYLAQKPSYQVLVIGNSLAAGLWPGLARVSESDLRLSVDGRYKEESGLARPEFYDWNAALPKILEANPADIAVVMVGSNDPQSIRDGDVRYAFGTPEWVAAYEAALDRLIAQLKARGVAVYWVGLPPMASPKYDESIRQIAALQKTRAEAAGLRYVDIRAALATAEGGFTDHGPDEAGVDRKLRAKDGVHFMKLGNNKIGGIVLAAIRADIEAADGAMPDAAPAPAAAAVDDGPIFGQAPASGADNIVKAAAPLQGLAAVHAAGPAELREVKALAGSNAERLFVKGAAPAAPKGRFDDFTAPPP